MPNNALNLNLISSNLTALLIFLNPKKILFFNILNHKIKKLYKKIYVAK